MFSPETVRRQCNGMLPTAVYQKIFDIASSASSDTYVEVGAAHGAATVCLALGLRASGRAGKVFAIERGHGGSRARYGNVADNERILRANLEHFNVSDVVDVLIGEVTDCASTISSDSEIGILVLDADGRIDRDLLLFYDRIANGGSIIIDDYGDRVRIERRRSGDYFVDQKHRVTKALCDQLVRFGLVEHSVLLRDTFFSTKNNKTTQDWPIESILEAYRALVFAEGDMVTFSMRAALSDFLERFFPKGLDFYRKYQREREGGNGV